jgi:hypothetical protein
LSSSRPPLAKIVTPARPLIEDGAHAFRQCDKVAAVQSHGADPDALGRKTRRQRDDGPRRRLGVVGVEQQRQVLRPRMCEALERDAFAVVSLNERMSHGAEARNAELFFGHDRRAPGEAGDVAGAGRHQAGIGAMGAAQAEIDQQLARCGENDARGLGSDQRLEMHDIDQPGLDQLRFRQRRGDPQDRLIGEEHPALRQGVDVAGEAERGETIEQRTAETAGAGQPFDLRPRIAQLRQVIERLLEAGGDQEAAALRQRADEEFEHGRAGLAMVQIGLAHVELVEIGEERAGQRIHRAASPLV